MKKVKNCEWAWCTFEFKPENLVAMTIHCAVLKTPEKAHQVGQVPYFFLIKVKNCDSAHRRYDENIEQGGSFWAKAVNDETYELASQDFSNTEPDHRKQSLWLLVRICIRIILVFYKYENQKTRPISYRNTCP